MIGPSTASTVPRTRTVCGSWAKLADAASIKPKAAALIRCRVMFFIVVLRSFTAGCKSGVSLTPVRALLFLQLGASCTPMRPARMGAQVNRVSIEPGRGAAVHRYCRALDVLRALGA